MRNEHTVVISQPQNSHSRLSLVTMTNMAERNRNISARNCGRRSGAVCPRNAASCSSWAWKSFM